MKVHFTDTYLLNPPHLVTVNLIGCGGTGSQMLSNLVRLQETLVALNHPGLQVYVWDADVITGANIGRQLFSPADVGQNKAICLVTRVNRAFGFSWEARPVYFTGQRRANITISCVDSAQARLDIATHFKVPKNSDEPTLMNKYWLDLGNSKKTGQVILGTAPGAQIVQPKSEHKTTRVLPDVTVMFPQLKKMKEVDQGPSCSLAQAISRQDLFINPVIANFGADLLWKLFRQGMIRYHGCYVNLESFIVNPIKIK